MHEHRVAFAVSPRQSRDEIPSSPCGIGVLVFNLLPSPEDRRFGAFAETVGIKQSTVVVIAKQVKLELHAQLDALARIGTVSDHVSKTINVVNLLAFDIPKHFFKCV